MWHDGSCALPNLGPHTCVTNTLLTESSPQPPNYGIWQQSLWTDSKKYYEMSTIVTKKINTIIPI